MIRILICNEYKAFDIYIERETEIRSSVLMKCSLDYQGDAFKSFSSSFSFSNSLFMFLINYIMTFIILLSINSGKCLCKL